MATMTTTAVTAARWTTTTTTLTENGAGQPEEYEQQEEQAKQEEKEEKEQKEEQGDQQVRTARKTTRRVGNRASGWAFYKSCFYEFARGKSNNVEVISWYLQGFVALGWWSFFFYLCTSRFSLPSVCLAIDLRLQVPQPTPPKPQAIT